MADEYTEETLQALTLPELQQELKKRGLKKSGPKPKLVQRLIEVRLFNRMFCHSIPTLTDRRCSGIQHSLAT